jgi:membrane protease YdiL (CAAX protease family)
MPLDFRSLDLVARGILVRISLAPLAWFIGIAFAFTWSLLPLAATSIPISLVALCGPAVAAFLVTAFEDRGQRREFFARMTDWRIPVRWYVLALTLPLLVSTIRSGVEYLCGARGAIEVQPITPLSLIVFVLVAGEEIGWRGFALPRLLPRSGPWLASPIVGMVWALWHLPLFSMPSMPQYGSPFFAFIIYTIALSVILTFLALQTRGSVILATLFHGAVNTFAVVNTAATPTLRGWTNALCYSLVALLIGMMWKTSASRETGSP